MTTIVNEPQIECKVSGWNWRRTIFWADNNILKIEFDDIFVLRESLFQTLPVPEKKKLKISSLRGKMKKLSEHETDHKLSEIRDEWERDF